MSIGNIALYIRIPSQWTFYFCEELKTANETFSLKVFLHVIKRHETIFTIKIYIFKNIT